MHSVDHDICLTNIWLQTLCPSGVVNVIALFQSFLEEGQRMRGICIIDINQDG